MARDDGFLDDIASNPDDEAPRRVYADWLEETDQPQRAEFIRLQCALAGAAADDQRRWAWEARVRQLLRHHGKGWAGPVRRLVKRWHFRRGFVEGVTLTARDFLTHAADLFRLAPIRHVRLLDAARLLPALARSTHLVRVRGLDLSHQPIEPHGFRTLAGARHLKHLEALNLRGTGLCNSAGMELLADCPALERLTALDLSDHRSVGSVDHARLTWPYWDRTDARVSVQARAIKRLARAFPRLTELHLGGYQVHLSRPALEALIDSLLGRLTSLDLGLTHLGGWWPGQHEWDGAQALVTSPNAANLRALRLGRMGLPDSLANTPHLLNLTTLDLSGIWLGNDLNLEDDEDEGEEETREAIGLLAEAKSLPKLATLRLRACHITNRALQQLAEATLPALRCLHLDQNGFGFRGLQALARSKLLGQLRVLTLQGSGYSSYPERARKVRVGDRGARALARSKRAANLITLDLGNHRIGDSGAEALASSPHLTNLAELHLWKNTIGPRGAAALLASESLTKLSSLDLRSNPLLSAACPALRERFGYDVRYGPGPSAENRRQERGWHEPEEMDFEDDLPFDED
ncbi:MAG: TIGR02996 domain-containing protein [Gemmataceae bacterium]|nr:TIGR02996 domain-containing protein [Gemmataceae bacterium]